MNGNGISQNHSNKDEQTNRVKMKKKEQRITVGLALSPYLVEEARKGKTQHKPNL
jgi:hypothetical protein